ncbi:hypothetical protein BU26DRAFT_127707 [Trematosphaeria pertusa]|uniref:Uncharacterized protein n=1 Tax=Trematosphaeria pertusa TaxID=390896 RepID=A0A6A6HY89_9PLEO|nr:uncharacterized protein BU26DRAFT_127707 [Trematosphaeria pertusa]KAF2243175.1 hypothetical protein BU26DRAFT_127707 [Trematosphaeria pertusa]
MPISDICLDLEDEFDYQELERLHLEDAIRYSTRTVPSEDMDRRTTPRGSPPMSATGYGGPGPRYPVPRSVYEAQASLNDGIRTSPSGSPTPPHNASKHDPISCLPMPRSVRKPQVPQEHIDERPNRLRSLPTSIAQNRGLGASAPVPQSVRQSQAPQANPIGNTASSRSPLTNTTRDSGMDGQAVHHIQPPQHYLQRQEPCAHASDSPNMPRYLPTSSAGNGGLSLHLPVPQFIRQRQAQGKLMSENANPSRMPTTSGTLTRGGRGQPPIPRSILHQYQAPGEPTNRINTPRPFPSMAASYENSDRGARLLPPSGPQVTDTRSSPFNFPALRTYSSFDRYGSGPNGGSMANRSRMPDLVDASTPLSRLTRRPVPREIRASRSGNGYQAPPQRSAIQTQQSPILRGAPQAQGPQVTQPSQRGTPNPPTHTRRIPRPLIPGMPRNQRIGFFQPPPPPPFKAQLQNYEIVSMAELPLGARCEICYELYDDSDH